MRVSVLFALFMVLYSGASRADNLLPPTGPVSPPILQMGENCAGRHYPPIAMRAREEGATLLSIYIDVTGKPTSAVVEQSSGYTELDQASIDCVLSWRFKPATLNSAPVASSKQYRIVWHFGVPRLRSDSLPCQPQLSAAELAAFAGKSALVQFLIDTYGHVEDAVIAASSNDTAFDNNVLQCTAHLNYSLTGSPHGTPWGGEFVGGTTTLVYADGGGIWHACDDYIYPPTLAGKSTNPMIVTYRVVAGGAIASAAVEQSSGYAELDDATLTCVRRWRYADRLFVGPNVDVKMQAKIRWQNGHAYVLETVAQ